MLNNLFRLVRVACVLCGSPCSSRESLCLACQQELKSDQCVCRRCALPLHYSGELECGVCQKDSPVYRSVYAFASYEAPLDQLILQFKFHQKLHIGHQLGQLMACDIANQSLARPDILLPVPLHASRLRQRGYNQALELAKPIARHIGVPLERGSCVRRKATPDQMGLTAKHRKSNLKGAFELNGNFQDKHVAVIDDVMTTGSTASELAQLLLQAGAKAVDVWVCARAVI